MTSQRPTDELSDEEYEDLLRREREKLAALLRRQNAGGGQYRLASLLIVVTLLAGFFAWMRTWNAEMRWSFITGLTILSIVFGMPIVVVWIIRSRYMMAHSYFWSVLIAQLVIPTLVVYGLCHSDTAVFVRAALIFVTSTVVCVALAGLLVRCVSSRDKSEFVKAAYIGALWPLGMPPLIGIWIGLWRGDLSVFFVEVIGLYSAVAKHFPLTIIACGATTAASCLAMAFRETAGQPLLK
jgi:hypothetical protein